MKKETETLPKKNVLIIVLLGLLASSAIAQVSIWNQRYLSGSATMQIGSDCKHEKLMQLPLFTGNSALAIEIIGRSQSM